MGLSMVNLLLCSSLSHLLSVFMPFLQLPLVGDLRDQKTHNTSYR